MNRGSCCGVASGELEYLHVWEKLLLIQERARNGQRRATGQRLLPYAATFWHGTPEQGRILSPIPVLGNYIFKVRE